MDPHNRIDTEPPRVHHRRPGSLDGTESPSNISEVDEKLHAHWHTLFGNMNAYQICNTINMHHKPKGITVTCKFINGREVQKTGGQESKKDSKRTRAWNKLFGNMSFEEIIAYINNVWIDPAYHFYIVE